MDPRSAVPTAIAAGVVLGFVVAAFDLPTPIQVVAPTSVASLAAAEVEWDIPVVRNESVLRFVDLFERHQPDRMAAYLKRSGRYEGMIRGKLRERGMPEDLLYLSMIESGFNPNALSKAQAVGLWQFMEDTGRQYGLRIDEYVDERRDPVRSTDAALDYLQDLHEKFGSWSLAAAAYNSGENRVARIMLEETGNVQGVELDFWRIRARLPRETREYVPLMFAAALVGKEPHKYGLEFVERLLPSPVERVPIPGGTRLDAVAIAIGIEASYLRELNAHLLTGVAPPGQAFAINIPEGRTRLFARNFVPAANPASVVPVRAPETAGKTHRVSNGESLVMIARQHGVTVAALRSANNLVDTVIQPGQVLRIPV